MKRKHFLLLILTILAGFSGYLLSKASFVGRVGISLFYKQYKFLRTWWQGGLLVLAIWLLLFFLQGQLQRKLSPAKAKLVQGAMIVIALIGLYFTYQDFQHTTSHRWLGERFHLGGYLFWVGWIIIGVYYLSEKQKTMLPKQENFTVKPFPANSDNQP